MKKLILLAVGAVALYQVAKKYGINSFQDVKDLVMKYFGDINLKQLVNVDSLKDLVSVDKLKTMLGLEVEEEEMVTA